MSALEFVLAVSVEGNWDESMNHKEYTEEFKSRVSDSSSFRCELYAMSGGCFGFVVLRCCSTTKLREQSNLVKMWAEGETRRIVAAQHAEAAVVPEADNATSASGSDSS